MRTASLQASRAKAYILQLLSRISPLAKAKKSRIGALSVLALFAVPVVAQATAAFSNDAGLNGDANSTQHQSQPAADPDWPIPENSKSQASNNSEVRIDSSAETTGDSNTDIDVNVNGQQVPVSKDGSVHKRITNGGNETVVDVQVDNESSSQNSSSSTTSINIEHYSSSSDEDNDNDARGVRRQPRR